MKKSLVVFAFLATLSINATAGNKIRFYFNHPVDNSVSTGVNAIYLNNTVDDTLIAYINKAKYTLDIAVYNFTSTASNVATAINSAYSRGVQVRWIYDAGQSNTGLPLLNAGINTLGSPQTANYTIMHNKFMVVDANSANPADAIVWTGSSNWNAQQFNSDYNNFVIIQDAPLAQAYREEFNLMWGGTGIAPNSATSKFGQYKTDLGHHNFTIDGYSVELYFSPSDGTNSHLLTAINSANTDLYVGMYTFTYSNNSSAMITRHDNGVYVASIIDNSSSGSSPYSSLVSGLGASNVKVYTGSNLYHNKFMIVDPSNKCSDPQVVTGSHNWSFSADTKNDENTLIIHSAEAANIYYQSFKSDFTAVGGTLTPAYGCPTSTSEITNEGDFFKVFPNPGSENTTISCHLSKKDELTISIYNLAGQKIATLTNNEVLEAGDHQYHYEFKEKGLYAICFSTNGTQHFEKIIIQ